MSNTKKNNDARSAGKWQGQNWIRQDARLACYLRDGLACVWCGSSVEEGAKLTLDHVIPHSQGGSNSPSNLVTACHKCNSVRGARSVEAFAADCARYTGVTSGIEILADIAKRTALDLKPFRAEAKAMIERRGSAAKALATSKE